MTRRPEERLVLWLGSHPGWHPATELATALGVTDRSVRNYITRVNSRSIEPVIEHSTAGYRLFPQAPLSAIEPPQPTRVFQLLRTLLARGEPASVVELAELLRVSESTVAGDIAQLNQMAARYGVRFEGSRSEIVTIGTEAARRAVMRQAVTEHFADGRSLDADILQHTFPSYDIAELKQRVEQALETNGLHSNAYNLNPLILDLVIAVDRITDGHGLSTPTSDPASDPRLAGATAEIIEYLRWAYGVSFDPVETAALGMLLASNTTLLRGATDHGIVTEHVGPSLMDATRRILARLDEAYSTDFSSSAFTASLALHISNLSRRSHTSRTQANPLAASIKNSHPFVHDLAVFLANELETETGIASNEYEVGFLAFHLGSALGRGRSDDTGITVSVVAPEYGSIANRIAGELQNHLGDAITIGQVVDTEQTPQSITGDLIVSLSLIPGIHPAKQVLVSPLLSDADLNLVEAQVVAQRRRNRWLQIAAQLSGLFHRDLFLTNPQVTGQTDLIQHLCDRLQATGAVPPQFHQQVLERERLSPTCFNQLVAIPHTLQMCANRTQIAVATFTHPIDWAGTPVRLVLLVAFSSNDRLLFRETFDQLVITLSEPRNIHRLTANADSFDRFLTELNQLMQD